MFSQTLVVLTTSRNLNPFMAANAKSLLLVHKVHDDLMAVQLNLKKETLNHQ